MAVAHAMAGQGSQGRGNIVISRHREQDLAGCLGRQQRKDPCRPISIQLSDRIIE
jgi:hypothetical protein